MHEHHLEAARDLLYKKAMVAFEGRSIGTVAAIPQVKHMYVEGHLQAIKPDCDLNYNEIFIRDNVPVALYCLLDGETDIVRNFLEICLQLQSQDIRTAGIFPTSFFVDQHRLVADYGQRAIGRVVSIDATLWVPILALAYVRKTGDWEWGRGAGVQEGLQRLLGLILQPSFREDPTLYVPDGAFMIDRPLDVWGSPLEVQVLLYGALMACSALLEAVHLSEAALQRACNLRRYIRKHYWLNSRIVQTLRRRPTEQYGDVVVNEYNIRTETIPHWLQTWLGEDGGFLIGNIRTGRPDFRFFTLGNCLAAIFDVISLAQQRSLFSLILKNHGDLVAEMPMRICHPPLDENDWQNKTGFDPKNRPWCYHNAGHWPCLLAYLTIAVLRHHPKFLDMRYSQVYLPMQELIRHGYLQQLKKLPAQKWPEYFDGPTGVWMGQESRIYQTWTIVGLLLLNQLLAGDPKHSNLLDLIPMASIKNRHLMRTRETLL